ncbi:hypothetical protein GGU10DRAFT_257136 [Lentinula aff. detonsa]|uniref:Calcineurin-like phosphoesterase domain-containing protein n=1 Tax=Lentinula aff. detonsa TaxID=2804958 RepID=A0AA38U185_9AGAR|nr:hypothetical protein GGU10DRAFT_257136 [Lentinula aff. detonsa]
MGLSARRHARNSSRLLSRTLIVNIWRLLAIILLIWGEFGAYFWSVSSCKWPISAVQSTGEKPTHVLLLADTQLEHLSAYRKEVSWSDFLYRLTYELYLKRSWRVTMRMKPNTVFFLGDMLSSGKDMNSEQEFQQYFEVFRRTFPLEPNVNGYYVPGNNDVGMGVTRPLSKHVRKSFFKLFGPFNQRVIVHNHTFILLDAPGLVDEDYTRAAQRIPYDKWSSLPGGPVEFVKTIHTDNNPVVLLSHIPLWRKDTAPCGPRREKGNIRTGVGHGYQNTLQKHTTNFLIESLQPSIIFRRVISKSDGDNRDYCEHLHKLASGRVPEDVALVPEITVKSFSPSRHIRRPGFQLLSLISPDSTARFHQSVAHDLCLLPDQKFIHWRLYAGFAYFTMLAMALFNIQRKRQLSSRALITPLSSHISLSGIPSPHPSLVTAAWTSYAPPSPTSPRGSLPGTIRTPVASSGPTFRAASRPGTPAPLLSPIPYQHEEPEDDSLYPPQYASTRLHLHQEETWSPEHLDHLDGNENGSRIMSPFLTPSGPQRRRPWSWTWSFVFRGRRRRMAIHAPSVSWDACKDLIALLGDGVSMDDVKFRQRGIFRSTVMDFLSVAWVFVMTWTVMAWWSFR